MAIDPNSLGQGIGLQVKPDPYADRWARGIERAISSQAVARQRKQEADQKALDAIVKSDFKIDTTKYHPLYLEKVNTLLKDKFDKILEKKSENPTTWINDIREDLIDLNGQLASYRKDSDAIFKLKDLALSGNAKDYYIDYDFLKSTEDPAIWKDWSKLKYNEKFGTTFDPLSGGVGIAPVRRYDAYAATKDIIKNEANWEAWPESAKATKIKGTDKGVITTKYALSDDATKAMANIVLNDPAAYEDYIVRNYDKIKSSVKDGFVIDENGDRYDFSDPVDVNKYAAKGLQKELFDAANVVKEKQTIATLAKGGGGKGGGYYNPNKGNSDWKWNMDVMQAASFDEQKIKEAIKENIPFASKTIDFEKIKASRNPISVIKLERTADPTENAPHNWTYTDEKDVQKNVNGQLVAVTKMGDGNWYAQIRKVDPNQYQIGPDGKMIMEKATYTNEAGRTVETMVPKMAKGDVIVNIPYEKLKNQIKTITTSKKGEPGFDLDKYIQQNQ